MAETNDGAILFKKANFAPPLELVTHLQKNADATVGSARIVDGNFKVFRKAESLDVPAFVGVLNGSMKPQTVLFHLGKRKVLDEDLQPAVILEDEGDAILVAFYDGDVDISKFKKIVTDLYAATKQDLEKTVTALDGPANRSKIAAECWKERGHISIMSILGDIDSFRSNPKYEEYGWGWVSNAFKPAAAPAVLPTSGVPKMSAADRIAAKKAAADDDMEGITAPAPKPGDTAPKPAEAPGTGPQPDTKIPDNSGKEEQVTLGPPPKSLNNREKRGWWTVRIGECPPHYKDAIVTVPKSKLKTVEAHVPTKVVKDGADQAVVSVVTTLLDPRLLESLKEDFADDGEVLTAEEREKFLKDNPSWSMQNPTIPIEKTFGWNLEKVRKLHVKYPMGACVFSFELIGLYQQALADIEALTAAPKQPAEPAKQLSAAERIAARRAGKAA